MQIHGDTLSRLAHAQQGGRLGHALLLTGGGGHGAYAVAMRLAQMLLCPDNETDGACDVCRKVADFSHPDFLPVAPLPPKSQRDKAMKDGRDPVSYSLREDPLAPLELGANWGITADQAREVIHWVSLSAWQAAGKVVLLAEADKVTEPTADILLKTLEEPPDGVTLVLVTARPQDLLPTVRSRCQEIRIPPLGDEALLALLADHDVSEEDARAVLGPAKGNLWEALALLAGEAGELRGVSGELLTAALNPKLATGDVMGHVREATARLSTAEVSELVRWILWWIRDTTLMAEGVLPVRPDAEQLVNWVKKVGPERMAIWGDEADAAFEMMTRNVTPASVLAALLIYPRDDRRLPAGPTFPPLRPAVPR